MENLNSMSNTTTTQVTLSNVQVEMRGLLGRMNEPIQHTLTSPTDFHDLPRDLFAENLRDLIIRGIGWLTDQRERTDFMAKFCMGNPKINALQSALKEHNQFFTGHAISIEFENFQTYNTIRMVKK
jgi:hypothetical protein